MKEWMDGWLAGWLAGCRLPDKATPTDLPSSQVQQPRPETTRGLKPSRINHYTHAKQAKTLPSSSHLLLIVVEAINQKAKTVSESGMECNAIVQWPPA
jgi:hypothetical protein